MGLNRLDQTMLSELIEGDRFYTGTNKQNVFEFIQIEKRHGKFEYHYRLGRIIKVSKSDKKVTFLRNIND